MLATRQPDLTVCLEQVHKPHNVSAIIRTADAVGVHQVHAVWPTTRMRTLVSSAAGSNSWVSVKTHPTIGDAGRPLGNRLTGELMKNCRAARADDNRQDIPHAISILF